MQVLKRGWSVAETPYPTRLDPAAVFYAYIGLGDKQAALSRLERAYTERSPTLNNMKVNPTFDPLRGEHRFQELQRRMEF